METREIKFRAKRKDTGEWVEGYGVIMNNEHGLYYIIHHVGNNITHHTEVRPETVGRVTGMKDKHGKEIWEGDLVYTDGSISFTWKVMWGEFEGMLGWICQPNTQTHVYPLDQSVSTKGEVIGNIHDQTENYGKQE